MQVLQKLKCALLSKTSIKDFYSGLTREQLERRKSHNLKVLLLMCGVWLLTWGMMIKGTDMDTPLMILYSITIIGTILSLWVDYRNKAKLIDQILKSR